MGLRVVSDNPAFRVGRGIYESQVVIGKLTQFLGELPEAKEIGLSVFEGSDSGYVVVQRGDVSARVISRASGHFQLVRPDQELVIGNEEIIEQLLEWIWSDDPSVVKRITKLWWATRRFDHLDTLLPRSTSLPLNWVKVKMPSRIPGEDNGPHESWDQLVGLPAYSLNLNEGAFFVCTPTFKGSVCGWLARDGQEPPPFVLAVIEFIAEVT